MKKPIVVILLSMVLLSCNQSTGDEHTANSEKEDFNYFVEQFADLKILRYKIPGFEDLSLQEKELLYYLSNAALCGRDILFDQFYKHNLSIRKTLEAIIKAHPDASGEEYEKLMVYTKRVWFSNGIHHHYSTDKFLPECSQSYFEELLQAVKEEDLPLQEGETKEEFVQRIGTVIFDADLDTKRINLDIEKGLIEGSATNFYGPDISKDEVDAFYDAMKDADGNPDEPIEYGLNSKLIKKDGKLEEQKWYADGMYGTAIQQVIFWLEKAKAVAQNEKLVKSIELLIEYYQTGDLATWDKYNINWVSDTEGKIDFINGFIEVYGDPMGKKATWESVVNFRDEEATQRTLTISDNAQWFEDHSPVDKRFKKEKVSGVSAKVIKVVQLGGDCYPSTPIGINLPNSNWVRKTHGSKSVTISNIIHAYHEASLQDGFLEEFAFDSVEIDLSKQHGALATDLHVDMHECLGHGSGQLLPDTDPNALDNYSNAIEESRADLFALYYVMDEKLIELGLVPSKDVAKAEYNGYIRNGLMTQLIRIELGKNVEQAHMRNRQLIAKWCYEKGKEENVIEMVKRDGKTYIKINDYEKLRGLFAQLLAEIQRIKSEGDFEAAKNLVETYAVKIDYDLHKEVLDRYKKLNLAPYSGFLNPLIKPVEQGGKVVDYELDYSQSYQEQMLYYSEHFSFLE